MIVRGVEIDSQLLWKQCVPCTSNESVSFVCFKEPTILIKRPSNQIFVVFHELLLQGLLESSHTILYKAKIDENRTLKLNARLAPHGNKDYINYEMRSDF